MTPRVVRELRAKLLTLEEEAHRDLFSAPAATATALDAARAAGRLRGLREALALLEAAETSTG